MNNSIFTRKAIPGNSGEQNLNQMRTYLTALEVVARNGRASGDPREVAAAVRAFANPSAVLTRLADSTRRCIQ